MEIKHAGAWRTITGIEVKHAGAWRTVTSMEVKHASAWRSVFSGITTPTVSLSSTSVSTETDFGTCWAQVRYDTVGVEYQNPASGSNSYSVSRGNWKDSGDEEGAWVAYALNSGTALYSAPAAAGTRVQCGVANRDYRQRDTNPSIGSVTSNITVTMYDAEIGGSSLGSGTYSLTAKLYNSCPTCCFTPDTLITMACGMQVPIKDIRVGDEIAVLNRDTGEIETEKVEQVITRVSRSMYRITFEDGEIIHASDDHPFHVPDLGPSSILPQGVYKPGSDIGEPRKLLVGDAVTSISGDWNEYPAKITKIEYAEYLDQVYTLGNSYFFANNRLVY